ncbi:choline/ethanolamine transporter flvcr2a isoform X3 [Leptinotarsa decemlineata]|uniref:choline/ethanolamine transporter flvcr2a isoform X3 n=1 Tax=Leptinotarsa decemlineata TaxID=7539 RepID=UPI003D304AC0
MRKGFTNSNFCAPSQNYNYLKMGDPEQKPNEMEIKLYRYRWVVLLIFCLFTVINFMQFLQFTIIANVITKYYDVDTSLVDMTGLIFFAINILLFLPVSYLIERYSLRVTAIVSMGFTLGGTVVKIFCADPSKFCLVLAGQSLCAIGQVYMLNIPSKLASIWFGSNEVSTACALAVLGTQLGAAIGSIVPPFIVKTEYDEQETGKAIHHMVVGNAILAAIVFVVVLIFFRAKPTLPPSPSQLQLLTQSEDKPSFFQNCKSLFRNKDYLLVLVIFGVVNGLWNSFGILVNSLYTNYFPNGGTDIGIITLMSIISGGCIGSVVFGYVLDKTHEFKKTSFAVLVLSSLTYILLVVSFYFKIRIATFFTIPLFGFFIASTLVISFEYALEVTYPIPESSSCSLLNAVIFLFAILSTLILESLIDAIGYEGTFGFVLALLLCCTFAVFLISSKLRRREANLAGTEQQSR